MPPLVLVVDDERQIRQLVKAALESHGYRTLEASSGENALTLLRVAQGRISLLLTDIQMSGMDGVALAKSTAMEYPGTPVLFMSFWAGSTGQLLEEVPRSGFLRKPFTTAALSAAVKELLMSQPVRGQMPAQSFLPQPGTAVPARRRLGPRHAGYCRPGNTKTLRTVFGSREVRDMS